MKKSLILFFALPLAFISCEKAQLNRETTTTEDHAVAEVAFEELKLSFDDHATAITDTASIDTSGATVGDESCPTITWTPAWDTWENILKFPKTVRIDFGDGCVGRDGKERRGDLVGTFSDWLWKVNATLNIVPENYFVDEYSVEGEKVYRYLGKNLSGNRHWHVEVIDGVVITPEGETIAWRSERESELIRGGEDFNPTNNVYAITGEASGNNRAGRDFEAKIKEALIIEVGCPNITQGVLDITPEELKTRSVDYGDGNCDDDAIVTIGNKTYDIKLR